jgi:hypothetical protein
MYLKVGSTLYSDDVSKQGGSLSEQVIFSVKMAGQWAEE